MAEEQEINKDQNVGKIWYKSKTIWGNIISIAALYLANKTGIVLTADQQLAILGVINVVLRAITKEPIVWN